MAEIVMPAEMIDAGTEQLQECRERDCDDRETAISVYLVMEGIREIIAMKLWGGNVH